MIVGFSKHGRGKAAGAIRYLTDRERRGVEREPHPTVLRGEPNLIADLIDGLAFTHRYTSGVLSFAPGERLTPAIESAIMDRFEEIAFAGLSPDQYAILWVRHEHAGHHELNFLVPRVELSTGKALNIAPPGPKTRALFDTFRSVVNLEHGLADPEDPKRAQHVRVPAHIAKLRAAHVRAGRASGSDPRELIAASIADAVERGDISDRADVLAFLRAADFEISREGKDYISVRDSATNDKYRLKGPHFHAEFRREELSRQIEDREREFGRPASERIAELGMRLECLASGRAAYNGNRYADSARSNIRKGIDRDLLFASQELAPQDRYEREMVEALGIRDNDHDELSPASRRDKHATRDERDGSASRTDSAEKYNDSKDAARWIRSAGGPNGQVLGDPKSHSRQQYVLLSESGVRLPSSEEPLKDDRARTSVVERLRAFGERLFDAGARFAQRLVEFTRGIEHALGRYDQAARADDDGIQRFAEAYRRFERSASRVTTLTNELSQKIARSLDLEHDRSVVIQRAPELER